MSYNKLLFIESFSTVKQQSLLTVNVAARFASYLIVLGTALAHFSGNQPYNALTQFANTVQLVVGIVLLFSSVLYVFNKQTIKKYKLESILFIAPVLLAFNSYCSFVNAGYVPEQIIEHTIKIGVPAFVAVAASFKEINEQHGIKIFKWFTALTFLGHGLFAIGLNYVPASFIEMTAVILKLSPLQSVNFLFVVGILDILFAVLLFTNGILRNIALYYLIIWGFITALARVVYPLCFNDVLIIDIYNGFLGMVYRLPHGIIPLFLLKYYKITNK